MNKQNFELLRIRIRQIILYAYIFFYVRAVWNIETQEMKNLKAWNQFMGR